MLEFFFGNYLEESVRITGGIPKEILWATSEVIPEGDVNKNPS